MSAFHRGGSMLGVALFLGVVFIILGAFNIGVELGYEGYDNMPVTNIADAQEGDTVKISATVNRPTGGYYVIWKESSVTYSKSRGTRVHTSYHHLDDFAVHDLTGTISVSMTSDDPIRITGGEYGAGGSISVVGLVEVMGTEKTIRAKAVAENPKTFSEQGAFRYFGQAFVVMGILMVAVPGVSCYLKVRERRRNPPIQISLDPPPIEEHI